MFIFNLWILHALRNHLRLLYGLLGFYGKIINIHYIYFFELMFNFEMYRATILPWRINGQNVGKTTCLQDISTVCMEIKLIRLISFQRKMGIFNNLFSSNNENTEEPQTQLNWIQLTNVEQLDEIEQNSSKKPQIIFKHSTS